MFSKTMIVTVGAMLLLAVSLCAQQVPTQTSIWLGNPTPGVPCSGYGDVGVNIYLTAAGGLTTCTGMFWQTWPFGIFQSQAAPVTMTGSDIAIFSAALPPLAPGACFDISYGVGTGLNGGTLKIQIDGSTISQPFTTSSLTQVNVTVDRLIYCNLPSDSGESELGLFRRVGRFQQFLEAQFDVVLPHDYAEPNDAQVSSPSAIDWTRGHTFTLTAAQSSGSVTPQYLRIKGGF